MSNSGAKYVWWNFVISCWLLIAFAAVLLISNLIRWGELFETYTPFAARVGLWPLVIGVIELVFWIRPFRNRENGARLIAGFIGILLLLQPILVTLLRADLDGQPVYWPTVWFFLYVAISHLAFACMGQES